MLEILNKRKKEIDKDNLKYINPFWEKALVKNQTNIFKWLVKFSHQEIVDAAPKFSLKEPIDYNKYLSFVNNANTLLFSKYKKMTDNLKVINKLRKMINDYGTMNGIYTFILIVNDFYEHEKSNESYDKRKYWVKLANDYISPVWIRYKAEFLSVLNDDDVLKQKAQDAFNFDKLSEDEVFFPRETMEIVFGFLKKIWTHKRITDKSFNTIYLYTLFVYQYFYSISRLMTRILKSYPLPKSMVRQPRKPKRNKKDSH